MMMILIWFVLDVSFVFLLLIVFDWGIMLLCVYLYDVYGVLIDMCSWVVGVMYVLGGGVCVFDVVFEEVCGDWFDCMFGLLVFVVGMVGSV